MKVLPPSPSVLLTRFSVRPNTFDSYMKAVRPFLSFVLDTGLPFDTAIDIDDALVVYISHQHSLYQSWLDDDGETSTRPPHTSVGYMEWLRAGCELLVPSLTNSLHGAKRAIAGWKRLHPSERHPPLSWPLTVLIAVSFIKAGSLDMGIAALLAFDCYLRISEFTSIRMADIVIDDRHSSDNASSLVPSVAIRLPFTKSRADESVVIARSSVAELVIRWLHSTARSPSSLVFPFSPADFRSAMKSACTSIGLNGLYVPHSLRGGGATHDFAAMDSSTVDINHIMIRGRWTSAKSLFTYCQAGKSLLLKTAESKDILRLADTLAASLVPSIVQAALTVDVRLPSLSNCLASHQIEQ
jgi:hypothetical protein